MNKGCQQEIDGLQSQIDYQVSLGKDCDMERLQDLMKWKHTLIDAQLTLTILRGERQIKHIEDFLDADKETQGLAS